MLNLKVALVTGRDKKTLINIEFYIKIYINFKLSLVHQNTQMHRSRSSWVSASCFGCRREVLSPPHRSTHQHQAPIPTYPITIFVPDDYGHLASDPVFRLFLAGKDVPKVIDPLCGCFLALPRSLLSAHRTYG